MFEASESTQWAPLHAEAREKYSHWYKPELNPGCEGRAKFLYEQLKARPSPWGKGLWKDEEAEKIAERCAQIFVENFLECPNERLIPQDPMEMVMALNDTGDLEDVEALHQIEDEFVCKIPEDFFQSEKTFGDFVECVRNGRGEGQVASERTEASDGLGWFGTAVVFALCFVGFPCFWLFCVYKAIAGVMTGLTEGWADVSIVALSIQGLVSCLGSYILVSVIWSLIRGDKRITWKQK